MQLAAAGRPLKGLWSTTKKEVESLLACGEDRVERKGRIDGEKAMAGLAIRDEPVALRTSSGPRITLCLFTVLRGRCVPSVGGGPHAPWKLDASGGSGDSDEPPSLLL